MNTRKQIALLREWAELWDNRINVEGSKEVAYRLLWAARLMDKVGRHEAGEVAPVEGESTG